MNRRSGRLLNRCSGRKLWDMRSSSRKRLLLSGLRARLLLIRLSGSLSRLGCRLDRLGNARRLLDHTRSSRLGHNRGLIISNRHNLGDRHNRHLRLLLRRRSRHGKLRSLRLRHLHRRALSATITTTQDALGNTDILTANLDTLGVPHGQHEALPAGAALGEGELAAVGTLGDLAVDAGRLADGAGGLGGEAREDVVVAARLGEVAGEDVGGDGGGAGGHVLVRDGDAAGRGRGDNGGGRRGGCWGDDGGLRGFGLVDGRLEGDALCGRGGLGGEFLGSGLRRSDDGCGGGLED